MGKRSRKRKKDPQTLNKSVSILVPVYKGSNVLFDALQSIAEQTHTDFEVLIGDDNKPNDTEEIEKTIKLVDAFSQSKTIVENKIAVRYIINEKNLGCHKNFENLVKQASNEIVLFLAQDDIFSKNAIEKVVNAFEEFPHATALTRPYFWFEDNVFEPIRYVPPYNPTKNAELSIFDGEKAIQAIYGSVGQISGLALKKSAIKIAYNTDIFPGHIYPIADMLKDHTIVFIKDYIVAIGTFSSQSRHISSVYDESPTEQWMRMFNTIYADEKYQIVLKQCITHMATNFEGLVQIKNYGKARTAMREILILLKYRWQNIFTPKFWFYSIITVVTPRFLLRRITDWYKSTILSKSIPKIHFNK